MHTKICDVQPAFVRESQGSTDSLLKLSSHLSPLQGDQGDQGPRVSTFKKMLLC